MLSLASSHYHVPVQISFLVANIVGIVFSAIHARLTEDLYPGASHRKLGWSLVVILGLQACVGVLARVVRNSRRGGGGFVPVPTQESDAYARIYRDRRSADSGHCGSVDRESSGYNDDEEGYEQEWVSEKPASGRRWMDLGALESALSARVPGFFNERVVRTCDIVYSLIARIMIPLGFAQICLGVVTGGGIFVSCPGCVCWTTGRWLKSEDGQRRV